MKNNCNTPAAKEFFVPLQVYLTTQQIIPIQAGNPYGIRPLARTYADFYIHHLIFIAMKTLCVKAVAAALIILAANVSNLNAQTWNVGYCGGMGCTPTSAVTAPCRAEC